jgi:hypothetical protein
MTGGPEVQRPFLEGELRTLYDQTRPGSLMFASLAFNGGELQEDGSRVLTTPLPGGILATLTVSNLRRKETFGEIRESGDPADKLAIEIPPAFPGAIGFVSEYQIHVDGVRSPFQSTRLITNTVDGNVVVLTELTDALDRGRFHKAALTTLTKGPEITKEATRKVAKATRNIADYVFRFGKVSLPKNNKGETIPNAPYVHSLSLLLRNDIVARLSYFHRGFHGLGKGQQPTLNHTIVDGTDADHLSVEIIDAEGRVIVNGAYSLGAGKVSYVNGEQFDKGPEGDLLRAASLYNRGLSPILRALTTSGQVK